MKGELEFMRKTKNRLVTLISILCIFAMLFSMGVPTTFALEYRKGSNDVSSSYRNGRYYQNLQNVELSGDDATDVVAVALSQLGYQEGSSTSQMDGDSGSGSGNYTEFNYNTGLSHGEAWCAAFCSWALYQSGVSPHNDSSSWTRYHSGDYNYIWCDPGCNNWANQLKGAGLYGTRESGYKPNTGDLIFFNNNGINHIGIVVWCDGSTVYTVEGNTSSAEGLNGEGGGVYYKSYPLTSTYINGYGKLSQKYESANVPKVDYSGSAMTPGWYIVRTGKTLSGSGVSVPAHHMFKVTSISGSTATVEYNGSTGTATLSQSTALQVTASGESVSALSGYKFGLTNKGVTVNTDGSWSVEMYLEGADNNFDYDAWYGIYDLGVTPTSSADSQGAWGYLVPGNDGVRDTGLSSGSNLPTKRFKFTFTSNDLDTPASGKKNPTLGGTYNVHVFFADHGAKAYSIARSIPITIPAKPTLSASYDHVIIIGVDGAGTYFNNADTPNMDRIFSNQNTAISHTVRTEDPSISAQNWTSMLHGVADEYHNITNDYASSNPYPLNSDYPSVFKVVRDNYSNAKLGSFTHWAPISTGIIEEGINVNKVYGLSDENISQKVCEYVNANDPKLVFVQFDEADSTGHSYGFNTPSQHEVITRIDGYIGQIYDTYQQKGLLDRTLFIVTSDHGGTINGTHGGTSYDETHVSFYATGSTVQSGTIGDMMVRDTAAIVLHALGCPAPNTYSARVPNNLFANVTRSTEYSFGLTSKGVTVNGSSYEIEMYIEGADNRFGHDAWFGIYDGNVTAEELFAKGGALSQGAWNYVVQSTASKQTPGLSPGTRLGAERRVFTFKSSDLDTSKDNNPSVGGTYTIFLFYTDGHDGNGYVVADSICVTIKANNTNSVNFGLTENGVTVRPDGSFSLEMYLEGAGSDFKFDTWVGMYDADVTEAELKAEGGNISQGAWGYIKNQNDTSNLNSGTRYVFSLDSNNFDTNKENRPVAGKTYRVFLFPTDGKVEGDNRQYDAVASFAVHIPAKATTGDGYQFGFINSENKVTANGDGTWSLHMFIEGADNRFDYDAWYGIYDTDVTAEQLLAGRGEMSQGAWGYINSSLSSGKLGSERHTFTFNSSTIDTNQSNNPKLGGTYNVVLFYNDRSPDGYVVARMIPFTIPTLSQPSFGVIEDGVTVNYDGSWSIEMYLENADSRFEYDAWFGIYNPDVTAEALLEQGGALSQGAWEYVIPGGLHVPGLSAGQKLDSGRIEFSFSSLQLTPDHNHPVLGGTYKIFLFYTDGKLGGNGYIVAAETLVTIPSSATIEPIIPGPPEDPHVHIPYDVYHDDYYHWEVCDCGEQLSKNEHDFTSGNECLCGYERPEQPNPDDDNTGNNTPGNDNNNNNNNSGTQDSSVGCFGSIAVGDALFSGIMIAIVFLIVIGKRAFIKKSN